jgi:hypothetical protein
MTFLDVVRGSLDLAITLLLVWGIARNEKNIKNLQKEVDDIKNSLIL